MATELAAERPATTPPVKRTAETSEIADDPRAFVEEELLVEEISIDGMCGVY